MWLNCKCNLSAVAFICPFKLNFHFLLELENTRELPRRYLNNFGILKKLIQYAIGFKFIANSLQILPYFF